MPFIPHTAAERSQMLEFLEVEDIDGLFQEIPASLRFDLPHTAALSEMQVTNLMQEQAVQDGTPLCFAGGGAYDHHIPAAVWELATRGEYYSAYTPYQAEASQGTLQLLYEYQSMMTRLMAMEVANASLYDGASALAEAILMAIRVNRQSKSKKILIPRSAHPAYRACATTIVSNQNIELVEIAYAADGRIDINKLAQYEQDDYAAIVIALPNYFSALEDVDALTDWAHDHNMLVIAQVNPLAMSLLKPPGQWGDKGADIACGEGQPLGIPLSSGGPYFGFMTTRLQYVRQLPGRLVGRTTDIDGKTGFSLTLQAREQHIRRSKATSNICTNQGLMVTAATIHMSIMGAQGLYNAAAGSHAQTRKLLDALAGIDGINLLFTGEFFNEIVIELPTKVDKILTALAAQNIVGGIDLTRFYPELGNALLLCATEKRSDQDIELLRANLARIIARQSPVKCNIRPKDF